jgi:DMSO/TMAO reductase YedYZ molybdopterin-dependent catalytic subunit
VTTLAETPETLPDDRTGRRRAPWWWGALAGLLAVGAALAVGELVTGLVEGTSSAVVSVGEVVVEHAPNWLKEYAIRTFGENDKDALIAGTTVTLVVISTVLGIASVRRLWIGITGTVLFGVVGMGAALTRPGASASDLWPSILGILAGVGVLWLLLGRTRPAPAAVPVVETVVEPVAEPIAETGSVPERPATMRPTGARPSPAPVGFDRRKFLVNAGLVAGGVVVVGSVGRSLQGRFSIDGARQAVTLPAPASPAAVLPAGVDLGAAGISPFVTPNGEFYRVDTALVAPRVTPSDWKLSIGGMVDNPITVTYAELLDREIIERDVTLVCVSNEIGGRYAGNARWLGVPLRSLLEEAGVQAGADQLVSRSVDGWTAGSPTQVVMDGRDAMVAIGMNGEPLPVEHGFPARLVVPGLYGYTSATKWVTQLELTTFDAYDPYWAQRGWAKIAPIKTMARIDTPRGLASVDAGTVAVGGVAWAVHRGIEAVEVRVDDGPWQPAQLGAVPGNDTWRQWMYPWEATSGRHSLTVRATDGTGETQTDERVEPIPDGATGWHSIVVMVR